MTNYEWLVKQNLLGEFLKDFEDSTISVEDMNNRYGHIYMASNKSYSEDVAVWLQEEHKELDVYVKLEDVINTICDMKIPTAFQLNYFADDCIYKIRKLPTKIMDEPRGSICQ